MSSKRLFHRPLGPLLFILLIASSSFYGCPTPNTTSLQLLTVAYIQYTSKAGSCWRPLVCCLQDGNSAVFVLFSPLFLSPSFSVLIFLFSFLCFLPLFFPLSSTVSWCFATLFNLMSPWNCCRCCTVNVALVPLHHHPTHPHPHPHRHCILPLPHSRRE